MAQDLSVTVTVRAQETSDGTVWIRAQRSRIVADGYIAAVRPEDVLTTIRPPWTPTEGQAAYYYGIKVKVIAIDEDVAWVREAKNGRRTTVGVEHLKEKA